MHVHGQSSFRGPQSATARTFIFACAMSFRCNSGLNAFSFGSLLKAEDNFQATQTMPVSGLKKALAGGRRILSPIRFSRYLKNAGRYRRETSSTLFAINFMSFIKISKISVSFFLENDYLLPIVMPVMIKKSDKCSKARRMVWC